jgi:hypothetical protein
VTLDIDSSTPIRSLARYRELVIAVHEAPASEQETNSVEWKGEADLAEKRWQAQMGRQILGMANRDPEVADNMLGGCGYIVVGVSPGELLGTQVHDTAKIESWISPYVGQPPNAPEWAPTYVEIRGRQVLVLTVEPPRYGHPAWPCRKGYSPDPRKPGADPKLALREGAVYVRHKASTREASAADIEMLSRRAAGARRRIGGVSLLLAPDSKAVAIDLGRDSVAAWAERERAALQPPPPTPAEREPRTIKVSDLPASSSLRTSAEMLAGMSGAIDAAMKASAIGAGALGWEPDRRTPEDYAKEVDGYIAKASKALPSVLLKGAHARGLGRIGFLVRNNTDDPVHGLQVEVRIPAKGVMALDEDEIPAKDLPARPVMLGKGGRNRFDYLGGVSLAGLTAPRYDYMTPAMRSLGRRVRIDNSNSVVLTFDPLDLYAEEEADLEEVWLFANPALAGTTLTAQWSARSRDASGVIRDTLEIEVEAAVPATAELLAHAEERDDQDDEDDGES